MSLKHFFDLKRTRTFGQALALYAVCFMLIFVCVGLMLGPIVMMYSGNEADIIGYADTIGVPLVAVLCTLLCLAVTRAKNGLKDPYFLVMIVLSVICSFYGGVIFGLIPSVHLTTKKPLSSAPPKQQ